MGRLTGNLPFNLDLCLHIRHIPSCGSRAFGASALAHVGLNEAVVQFAPFQAFQHFHAVGQAIHKYLVVGVHLLFRDHGLDYAAADGVHPVDLRIRITHGGIFAVEDPDLRLIQPDCQLLKGQYGINGSCDPLVPDGLLLFRDAGAQKYDLHIVPVQFLDIPSVGHHGGNHRGHQRRALRIIFFNQVIDAGTAGSDDVGHLVFPDDPLVFPGHHGRPLRRLPYFCKAQFEQCVHHLPRPVKIQHADIGRGDGDNGTKPLPQKALYPLHVAGKGLGILGADLHAFPAVDAVIRQDTGLLLLDRDRLHLAVAHAFVTVAALRILKINYLHVLFLLLYCRW